MPNANLHMQTSSWYGPVYAYVCIYLSAVFLARGYEATKFLAAKFVANNSTSEIPLNH